MTNHRRRCGIEHGDLARQQISQQTRGEIGGATGCAGDDQRDRPRRISLLGVNNRRKTSPALQAQES